MNAHNYLTALALALALLPGCRRGGADGFVTKGPDGVVTLAVGATADLTKPVTDFRLEDYYEPVGEILPSDDPRTFMRGMNFAYYDANTVLAYSGDRVIRLSLADGSFQGEYGHKGRGPGEYTMVLSAFVRDGRVYVNDIMSTYHVYEGVDGHHLQDVPLFDKTQQFCALYPLEGDYSMILYASTAGKKQVFDIIDGSGNLVRESSLQDDNEEIAQRGGIRIGYSIPLGEDWGVPSDRDRTLYRISPERDIPWVRFDYGRYSPTDSPLMVLERFSVSGPFFLASLNGESSYFRAVYDLQRCRLLFVTENLRNNTRAERAGIPYELDGQTLFLWPEFAARDLLICRNVHTADNYYCFRLKK